MKHIIGVLVENEFGVLSRISALFSGRGFNIESLTVAETEDSGLSQMTIVTCGEEQIIEQITKQLNKLINVIKVVDYTDTDHVTRGLMLVKVAVEGGRRLEVLQIVDVFRARIIDMAAKSAIVEITGSEDKLQAFLDVLVPYGIKEVNRTGVVAMNREAKSRTRSKIKAA
ncbi:MAG: acetolactate synthase small subunit [Deltaproteobacteria bacterium]|nr:acetolactate synthase small subunit [Candidatus Anaeroferrophillus wilburensis]MBN2888080.1 acetolactate synthase small subunit [Deltaproteobacteria bacterium]